MQSTISPWPLNHWVRYSYNPLALVEAESRQECSVQRRQGERTKGVHVSNEVKKTEAAPENRCWRCLHPIEPGDRFCRHCGRRQVSLSGKLLYHPISIIILTLTILGPFALFLVWKSPFMNRTEKIILSIGIALVTAVVIYASIYIVVMIYHEWQSIDSMWEQLN